MFSIQKTIAAILELLLPKKVFSQSFENDFSTPQNILKT